MKKVAALSVLVVVSCTEQASGPFSSGEARTAVETVTLEAQGEGLALGTIDLGTKVTAGASGAQALEDVRAFVATQVPCASVAVGLGVVVVDFGASSSSCAYRGHTLTGQQVIKVVRTNANAMEVDHAWKDLSDGKTKVGGTAQVTWTDGSPSRKVTHDLTWTRISDGRTVHGTGDATFGPASSGGDVKIVGSRAFDTAGSHWEMATTVGITLAWASPVLPSGGWTVVTPWDKNLILGFNPRDATHVRVTVGGGQQLSYDFLVDQDGRVTNF